MYDFWIVFLKHLYQLHVEHILYTTKFILVTYTITNYETEARLPTISDTVRR